MPEKCKIRERLAAAGQTDVPAIPITAVRGRACFRCFAPNDNILKCIACRRAGYCSKDCQKMDWTVVHKAQCKLLKRINEADINDYQERRTWGEYRTSLLRYVRLLRDLDPNGNSGFIVQAQPYCSTCYRSSIQLSSRGIPTKVCTKCYLVHHCSECTDSHSEAQCIAYIKQNEMESFRIEYFEDSGRTSVVECTQTPRSDYRALDICRGWHDYFKNISDKPSINGSITEDFDNIIIPPGGMPEEQRAFEQSRRKFLILGTDILTMPLTIISALEDLQLVHKASLDIHLLGATSREFMALTCFEEMLHLMPSLKKLAITAVGPSSILFGAQTENYAPYEGMPSCPPCQSQARTRTIASYQGLYHNFAATSWYKKPDLIVAFNSGFFDGDDGETDWKQTIRFIVDSGVPSLFTTYNGREAGNERRMLDRLGAQFIAEPTQNKWRSLVPVPELLDEEYGFWHQNDYRYIINGKK